MSVFRRIKPRHRSHSSRGFTIIEVLIVLAIAGLILLILFRAVPAAQRTQRNNARKNATTTIGAELDNYAQANSGQYPDTPAQMCSFITQYLVNAVGSSSSCLASFTSSPSSCVLVKSSRFSVCYHDRNTTSHSYIGPEDEISIMLGHWCNSGAGFYSGEPAGDPVTSGNDTFDNEVKQYVVWTNLEGKSGVYCVDNYSMSQ